MRQAGIIAAPGIIAIEKMVSRLKEDHENAHHLYKILAEIEGLEIDEPDTNILFIEYSNFDVGAHQMAEELKKRGILVYGEYGTRTRFVCHRMISRDDVDKTANAVRNILSSHRK
jgi:threonine aldolase